MKPNWDDHVLKLETIAAVAKRFEELKAANFDPVSAVFAETVNFDGDRSFWAKAFSQTRAPEEIMNLRRDLIRNKIRDSYAFFKLHSEYYKTEYERMKPIAKAFQEIEGLQRADFEAYMMKLIGETLIGIDCVLYEIWAGKFYEPKEEFDEMMQRVYKKHEK